MIQQVLKQPGPSPRLSDSEVITIALYQELIGELRECSFLWFCLTFRDSEIREGVCRDENSLQEPIGLLSFPIMYQGFHAK